MTHSEVSLRCVSLRHTWPQSEEEREEECTSEWEIWRAWTLTHSSLCFCRMPNVLFLLWWLYHLQCWINISSHISSSSPERLQNPQQHPPSSPCGICRPAGESIIRTASPELTLTSPPRRPCVWRTSILIRCWLFSVWRNCWSPHRVRKPDALPRSLALINLIFHSFPKSDDGREQEGEQTINQDHTLNAQEMTSQRWVRTLPERTSHQSHTHKT